MAQNSTGLSISGLIKWILLIAEIPCVINAWQGIVNGVTATGYSRSDAGRAELLTGHDALWFGLRKMLWAALLTGAAWAIWFFWQRYED